MLSDIPQNFKNQDLLRTLLQFVALGFILALPFAEPTWHPSGSEIILGAVVPAIAPIIFILLMLDSLICVIWRGETEDQFQTRKLTFSLRANFIIGFALIFLWITSFADALFG